MVALAYATLTTAIADLFKSKPAQKAMPLAQFKAYMKLKQGPLARIEDDHLLTAAAALNETEKHLLLAQVDRKAKQIKYRAESDFFMGSSSSGRSSESDAPAQTYVMPSESAKTLIPELDFHWPALPSYDRGPDVFVKKPFVFPTSAGDGWDEPTKTLTTDQSRRSIVTLNLDAAGTQWLGRFEYPVDLAKLTRRCSLCTDPLYDLYYRCLDCKETTLLCPACEACQVPAGETVHTGDHVLAKIRKGQE
jgi:hypothetical protein